jgi:hypothetical protein
MRGDAARLPHPLPVRFCLTVATSIITSMQTAARMVRESIC